MRQPQSVGNVGLGWTLVHSEGTKKMIKAFGSEGQEYFFRVTPENKCGLGPSLETKKPTLLVDPFIKSMPVRDAKCISKGVGFVEIAYEKPEWDGGNTISCYKIFGRQTESEKWEELASHDSYLSKRIKIENSIFEENQSWILSIVAVNKAGFSDDVTIGPIEIKSDALAPKIELKTVLEKGCLTLKAGQIMKLNVSVCGIPFPEVTFFKDGVDMMKVPGCSITNKDGSSELSISGCARKDTGKYKITAKNEFGEDDVEVEVVVIDKPSACTGPIRFITILKDRITLCWEAPADIGGTEITNYCIEKAATNRMVWGVVTESVRVPIVTAPHLVEGNEYIFRVRAQNKMGVSTNFIESSPVVAKNPFSVPSAPSQPEITKFGKDFVQLTWSEPTNDGGKSVVGYFIEKREKKGVRWIPCNMHSVPEHRYKCIGLNSDVEYQFRIKAENEVGISEPSMVSKPMQPHDPIVPPQAPLGFKIVDQSASSVSLAWVAPAYDGGSPLIGFVVEYCKENDKAFNIWTRLDVKPCMRVTNFKIDSLKTEQKYCFRVCALNNVGTGEYAELEEPFTPEDITIEPSIDVEDCYRQRLFIRAEKQLVLKAKFSGRPQSDAKWSKSGEFVSRKADISIDANTTTLIIPSIDRTDSGKYTLEVGNESGTVTANFNVTVQDTPGPVQDFMVKEVTQSSATISFQYPENDGGAEITHFRIDKRESDQKTWSRVNHETTRTNIKVEKLFEGKEYYFRIVAVNRYGEGVNFETVKAIRARKSISEPGPVGRLQTSDMNQDRITLKWVAPEDTGDAKIVGYTVEVRKQDQDFRNYRDVIDCECVITGLEENTRYMFGVKAKNEQLVGSRRDTEWITIKEPAEKPSADILKEIVVRGGEPIQIDAIVKGFPRPVIQWQDSSTNDEIIEDERVAIQRTNKKSTLLIMKSVRTDSKTYTLQCKNKHGITAAKCDVTVVDIPTVPTGPMIFTDVSNDSLTLNWEAPSDDGGCGLNGYIIDCMEVQVTGWKTLSSTVSRTHYRVDKLNPGSEYMFRVRAENKIGQSDALISETIVAKYQFTPPECPRDLKIIRVTRSSALLAWDVPSADGGAPVKGYNLERKEINSLLWYKVNKGLIKRREFNDISLVESLEYQFRVIAVNQAGSSSPSSATKPIAIREPCDPPMGLEILDITDSTIELVWNEPRKDGGTRLVSYGVEARKCPDGLWWTKANTRHPKTTCTIKDLEEGENYEFRVTAKTISTVSAPSEVTSPVLVRQLLAEPDVEVTGIDSKGTIEIRSGSDLILDCTIMGKPKPEIFWMKNEEPFRSFGESQTINNYANRSIVTIKNANRQTAGNFVISAKNTSGEKVQKIKVVVLDKPGTPENIKIAKVFATKLNISWDAPALDGGSAISNYVLEKRETSRPTWVIVSSSIMGTEFTVPKLIANHEYVFRISAENKFGIGPAKTSNEVIAKNPFGPPKACPPPMIQNATSSSITVSWKVPQDDGGKAITGYYLEKRETRNVQWSKVNRRAILDRTHKVTGISENTEYEFRVLAENQAGIGDASAASVSVVAVDPTYPPAPPAFPKVDDMTKSSVALKWGKPAYDGGMEITQYAIYISKPEDPEKFTRCGVSRATSFNVTGLMSGRQYRFKVTAANQTGESEPALIEESVIPEDIVQHPEIELNDTCQRTVLVRAGAPIRVFAKIAARPAPVVSWTKIDGEIALNRTEIKQSDWEASLVINDSTRDDTGKYIIKLENSAGSKQATITVRVLDTPSAPTALVVKDIKETTVQLAWEMPIIDGGAMVNNYVVERRLSGRKAWSTVSNKNGKCSINVNDLETGKMYHFRVHGENEYGIGVAAEIGPVKVCMAPGPVNKLEVADHSKTFANLTWTKPLVDGGSRITNYLIDWCVKADFDAKTEKWTELSTQKNCTFKVTGLEENVEYIVRVSAMNDSGLGESREKIIAGRDPTEIPTLNTTEFPDLNITLREGTSTKIKIPFTGKPKPELKWKKREEDVDVTIKEDSRILIDNSTFTSMYINKNVQKCDAGVFTITASNAAGEKTIKLNVTVLGRPGPVEKLELCEITADFANLRWQ